jgi:hypothetical protein
MLNFRVVDRDTARADPLGAVWLDGDHGGRTNLICRAQYVEAAADVLRQLAADLDAKYAWSAPQWTRVLWVVTNRWNEWAGDQAESGLWIDKRLFLRGVRANAVMDVLAGRAARLPSWEVEG